MIKAYKTSGLPDLPNFDLDDLIEVVKNPNTPQARCFRARVSQLLAFMQANLDFAESGAGGGGEAAPFISGLIDFEGTSTPFVTSAAHGLGATPKKLRVVIRCITNDATSGYEAGDEIDASQWFDGSDNVPLFTFGANATNVFLASAFASADYPGGVRLCNKAVGGFGAISNVQNFRLKIYAWA